MQAFFATPGQVRGTQSKKENLWALSVFRLNLMLNHHVGRQPPEICVFFITFLKICEMLVKYQLFEYFRKIFRNRTPNSPNNGLEPIP